MPSRRNFAGQRSQGPLELVDDRKVGGGTRPRERIQVDGDDAFAEALEGLGAIAVLQGHDHHVGASDPTRIDQGPVGRKPGNPTGRADP